MAVTSASTLAGAASLAKQGGAVIASGGVGTLQHVREAAAAGVEGLIVGKALYEARFTVRDALDAAKGLKA
jgi:phosphoribosylformimino-5-aminoimidazole carboxamide ribotide isomerase